jgi:serine/threonine protein kinase
MPDRPSEPGPPFDVLEARLVDEVCDRFEDAWRRGERPSLHGCLAGLAESIRPATLRELLRLDVHYRRRAGESPTAADYRDQFPDHLDLVAAQFGGAETAAEPAGSSADGVRTSAATRPAAEPRLPLTGQSSLSDTADEVANRSTQEKRQPEPRPAGIPESPAPPQQPARLRAGCVAAGGDPLPHRIPGYEILGVLGRGGMGVVYRARDLALNRVVALKMVLAGSAAAPEQLARFRAEAEALARLRHPHIVQVHTCGEHAGQPYFVLEYVEGGSLAERLRGQPQPPRDAARLVLLLARAVHAAHQAGIVHRDLKPANILLGPPADEPALNSALGWPKVTDFGLARYLDEASRTADGTLLGTPSYMAPEQAAGKVKEIGPAADVYSLGAILYGMLTGRPPFRGESVLDTLDQVRNRAPEPPSRLNPAVPFALETICLKCLQKMPADRYVTAAALVDDLRRFLCGEATKVPERATQPVRVPDLRVGSGTGGTSKSRQPPPGRLIIISVPVGSLVLIAALLGGLILLAFAMLILGIVLFIFGMKSLARDTTNEHGNQSHQPPLPLPLLHQTWAVRSVATITLLSGLALLVVVIVTNWSTGPSSEPTPDPAPQGRGQAPPGPPQPAPLRVRGMQVRHFANLRNENDQPKGLLGKASFNTRLDDSVTVEAELSRPAYAFVIAFRPDGTEELCFPEREDEPPPLTDRPRYPFKSRGVNYGLNEGEGLQVFAVAASASPLPSFNDWRGKAPKSPWGREAAPPGVVWFDDGTRVEAFTNHGPRSGTRAKGQRVAGQTAVVAVTDWLRAAPGVETAASFGFAVLPKERP